MAITQTGAIHKAFSFDNVSSRDFGVYITGEAVFDAPEREVEMIAIPGRNGAFALDQGRFENIEVKYPAGIFADNEADFAQAVSDLRNFLCSKKGYFRLTDEYNPNEYRMAVYKSGLEVLPVQLKAGEFEIIFECKPQRWLMSGETAISVSDGQTITNPTFFDASPMLEVEGYGTIGFNNYEIEIDNAVMGEVETSQRASAAASGVGAETITLTKTIDYSDKADFINQNDQLTVSRLKINEAITFLTETGSTPTATISSNIGTASASASVKNGGASGFTRSDFSLVGTIDNLELTAFTNESYSATVSMVAKNTSNTTLGTISIAIGITNTSAGTLTCEITSSYTTGSKTPLVRSTTAEYGRSYIDSTLSILGNPIYVDCDLGEAYKIENDTVVGLNQHIDLGSNLPVLSSGVNTIAFDNTITDLKVIPRWWIV